MQRFLKLGLSLEDIPQQATHFQVRSSTVLEGPQVVTLSAQGCAALFARLVACALFAPALLLALVTSLRSLISSSTSKTACCEECQ